ncbi:hypothetical protein F7725_019882 [Dissostichus mawsoni]|uniref:Protein kinase domain-containing protein n=1 Tax=Dissostichus mawsoni TaxID=36200 RepID=A0A7J5YLW8_DISMA|nr:hypothetical protein F7725_019882 [Dissostichus mawsoni]
MASTFIDESVMKTPTNVRVKKFVNGGTPITIPASPFMKKLGCGTGVNVYLMDRMGKLNASPWAVKKINTKCASNQMAVYQKRLNEEAKVLKGINHPNIVVALHVARGLQYLHNEKKLLHGDMKSCNVVIKGDFETVKICDVGVSLQLDENMRGIAEYIGTEPWTPKEALEDGEITDKADIFAYGLTLWEMMSLAMPHLEMLEDKSMEVSFDEDAYYDRLGTRPAVDLEALGSSYRRMVELFYMCTEENPKKRPSATQILQALESNDPLNKTPSEVIVID